MMQYQSWRCRAAEVSPLGQAQALTHHPLRTTSKDERIVLPFSSSAKVWKVQSRTRKTAQSQLL